MLLYKCTERTHELLILYKWRNKERNERTEKGWGAESQQTDRSPQNPAAHFFPDVEPPPCSDMWKLFPYQTPNSCFLFNQLLNSCK